MRPIVAACALALPLAAAGQAPPPAQRAGCDDLLVFGTESYDFSAGGHGFAASVDGVRCLEAGWSAQAGASTYDVAGSRWSIARLGATTRRAGGHVAFLTATAGSGRNANGRFDYRKLADGISYKANDALYLKAEHEYFDIDRNRGHVGKLGGVAVVGAGTTLEVTGATDLGGNLSTRALVVRADTVIASTRLYGGFGYGRLLPQVRDIATGERAADVVSREAFAGVAIRLPLGELVAAADTIRTGASRRNTFTLGWQVPL